MTQTEKPIVLSYCGIFLKQEMLHIYRQVSGLQRYRTIVLTPSRENKEKFPFSSLVEIPLPRVPLLPRLYRKYVQRLEPLVYRGEYDQLLASVNREQEADLIHVYFGHIGVHLLPFLRRWEKPKIVSFHGMDIMPHSEKPRYKQKMQELFDVVDLVLARSGSLKQKLIELGCAEKKIRLNRTGIPMEAFPPVQRTAPQEGKWQLIQACRLIEKKGIEDAVRAFAKFREKFPLAQFHLVGDGPLRSSLQKLGESLQLGNSLQFHGFCSQEEVYRLLAQSHIFLHPSRITSSQDQEGIPNSLLEAMATGLPVVATYHGGIPEAVTHGQDGWLVAEGDWQALARYLHQLANAVEEWAALGVSAAKSVRAKFDQTLQIENLEKIYDEARAINLG